jgi:O-antigen/teichoic acid export membrane protein
MLVDPTTKVLIAKFGGLSSVTFFEMANRMVTHFRSLLVSANQVIVPHVANLQEKSPEEIHNVYLDSYRVMFFLALPLFAVVTSFAPLASELWIGHYEQSFVVYAILISAAFWLNALTAPAYFMNLGTGLLHWNTWSFVVMAPLNVSLGYLLGVVWGGVGVVLGLALAVFISSILVILGYHRYHHIALMELFPSESKQLFIACSVGLMGGWAAFNFIEVPAGTLAKAALSFMICIIVIAPAFWIHSLQKKLTSRLVTTFHF